MRADVLNIKLDVEALPGVLVREDEYHVRMGAGATDAQWTTALGEHSAKVLRLEYERGPGKDPARFFAEPFTDASAQAGFMKRLDRIPGIFCCAVRSSPARKGAFYKSLLMGQGVEASYIK
jgi:hypothetical protein